MWSNGFHDLKLTQAVLVVYMYYVQFFMSKAFGNEHTTLKQLKMEDI